MTSGDKRCRESGPPAPSPASTGVAGEGAGGPDLAATPSVAYETEPTGPFGSSRGHCFPGSTMPPFSPQYAVPCKGPNAFTWGEEVMKFFEAHPKR